MSNHVPGWLAPRGHGWTVLSDAVIHDNPWFATQAFRAIAPTGVEADYYMLAYKNWAVGVLPLHDDGSVSLIGQWRFPYATYSLELPEGGHDRAGDPLEGAKRELREEAGLEAETWRPMLTMQLSNASSNEVALLYLATGLSQVAVEPDATEQLTQVRVPFSQALEAAIAGRIQDSLTVAALLRLHHMAYKGDLGESMAKTVLG